MSDQEALERARWSGAQLEELKRELQAKHLLDPIYRRCADAIGSVQFDLVDALRAASEARTAERIATIEECAQWIRGAKGGWPTGAGDSDEWTLDDVADELLRALATPPQSPATTAHDYADPNDVFNSCRYHTGKLCVEEGCNEPAGTWWSRLWCFAHNVERMDRINSRIAPQTKEPK